MEDARILIVDDDYDVLQSALLLLRRYYTDVQIEQVPEGVIDKIKHKPVDLILLDMNFTKGRRDGEEGMTWLRKILETDPEAVVVMITAYGDLEIAVKAIHAGAMDFVLKPWKNQKLLATIHSALHLKQSKKEIHQLRQDRQGLAEESSRGDPLIGRSRVFSHCLDIASRVAKTDTNVLITGENGTGKELIARYIHRMSPRREYPFVSVDLGSLAENLFESELFGHKKGAFTDAREDKPGRFELAREGSIFLDEIGNLNHGLQAKLLAAIQKKSIYRVGSTQEVAIDFRLISATNRSLHEMVSRHEFREDLLYRINTVEIKVPPLREREEDLELLFHYYLDQYKRKYGKPRLKISGKTLEKLNNYSWPGNVRELQHTVERAVILNDTNRLTYGDIIPAESPVTGGRTREILKLEEMEKQHIIKIIQRNHGNITRSAIDLGISRTALHRRIRKYGI
jgi:DNA-binding NtrC family response regulator